MRSATLRQDWLAFELTEALAERRHGQRSRRARSEQIAADCDGVTDIAAVMFNVSGRDLRRPGRSAPEVCRVRQIAMYVAHVALGLSMREVGDGFGRDRTTVLHACHQIEDLRDDDEFDAMVAAMERVVRAAFLDDQAERS